MKFGRSTRMLSVGAKKANDQYDFSGINKLNEDMRTGFKKISTIESGLSSQISANRNNFYKQNLN